MPLRTAVVLASVLASLLVHGVVGYAIWPRLEEEKLEVLDLGKGLDVVLTPMGMVMSAVSNRGDNLTAIETQNAVSADQHRPAPVPPSVTPSQQLRDVAGDVERKQTEDVAPVREQKPTQQSSSVAAAEQLHDTVNDVQSKTTQDVVAVQEQNPTQQPPTAAAPEQLHDVADDVEGKKIQEVAAVQEQRPAQQTPAAATPEQLRDVAAELESKKTPDVVTVQAQTPAPQRQAVKPAQQLGDVIGSERSGIEQEILKAALPPQDELAESKALSAARSSSLKPIQDQNSEVLKVETEPQQVVMVTEQSSGEVRAGGDARTVGIYLGKVNGRVQNSKVNPNSKLTGVVVLKYTIGTDGSLLSKEVALSSRSTVLDAAALETLIRAAPFPPIPPDVSVQPMVFTQAFKFVVR